MAWMEFVASLVESLAWPVAALLLAVVLKPTLTQLASGGVRRWKAGVAGVEVEYWDRETAVVKSSIDPRGSTNAGVPHPGGSLTDDLAETINISPAAAVVEAFARVEAELRMVLVKASDDPSELDRMSARELARAAVERDLVTPESATAIEGLTVMRNLAVLGQANRDLDPERATEFVYLAEAVLFALRSRA